MTGPEAEQTAARISIHLRRNEFAACHEILGELENRQDPEEDCTEFTSIPVAEVLGHELRYVNKLESAGYVYMEDLEGVDLQDLANKFSPMYLSWFGRKGVKLVEEGYRKAAEIHERRRRRRLKKLAKDTLKIGESLLVEGSE